MSLQVNQVIANRAPNKPEKRSAGRAELVPKQKTDTVQLSNNTTVIESKFGPLSLQEKSFVGQFESGLVYDFTQKVKSKKELLCRLKALQPLLAKINKRKKDFDKHILYDLYGNEALWKISALTPEKISQWQGSVWIDSILSGNAIMLLKIQKKYDNNINLADSKLISDLDQKLPFNVLLFFVEHSETYDELMGNLQKLSNLYNKEKLFFEQAKKRCVDYFGKVVEYVSSPLEFLSEIGKLTKFSKDNKPLIANLTKKKIDLGYFWEKSKTVGEFRRRLLSLNSFLDLVRLKEESKIKGLWVNSSSDYVGLDRNPFDILLCAPNVLGAEKLLGISGLGEKAQSVYLDAVSDAGKTYAKIMKQSLRNISNNDFKKIMILPGMRVIVTEDIAPLLNNPCYLNYLRKKYPNLGLKKAFSMTIAFKRNLKAMGVADEEVLGLNEEKIDLCFSEMMAANNYVFGLDMVGSGINVMVITADPENNGIGDWHFDEIVNYAKKYGSNIVFAKKGAGPDKTKFLETVRMAKGPTRIFILGHGSGSAITCGKGEDISYQELMAAVSQNENPQNIIIVTDCCNAYEFYTNFEGNYPQDILMPIVIGLGGNKGMLSYEFGRSYNFKGSKVGDFYAFFEKDFFKAVMCEKGANLDAFIRLDWRYIYKKIDLIDLFETLRHPQKKQQKNEKDVRDIRMEVKKTSSFMSPLV